MSALMQRHFLDSKPEQPLNVMQSWCKAGSEQSSRFEEILNTDGRTNDGQEIFVTLGPMCAYKFKTVGNVSSGRRKGKTKGFFLVAQPVLDPILTFKFKSAASNDKKMVKAYLSRVGASCNRVVTESVFSQGSSIKQALQTLRGQISKLYTNEAGIEHGDAADDDDDGGGDDDDGDDILEGDDFLLNHVEKESVKIHCNGCEIRKPDASVTFGVLRGLKGEQIKSALTYGKKFA
eukprot:s301_g12.t1